MSASVKQKKRQCACGALVTGKGTRCRACNAAYAKELRSSAVASKVRKVSIVNMQGLPEDAPSYVVTIEHSEDTGLEDFFVGPFATPVECDYYVRLYLGAFDDHVMPASSDEPCNHVYTGINGGRQCAFVCGHCETYTKPGIKRWSVPEDKRRQELAKRNARTRKVPLDQGGDCGIDDIGDVYPPYSTKAVPPKEPQ